MKHRRFSDLTNSVLIVPSLALLGLAALAAGPAAAAEQVLAVERVCAVQTLSYPPTTHIKVLGTVNSAGWSNGRLVPRAYDSVPAGGILDLDFMATPPGKPSASVISRIKASAALPNIPWIKGVRVHAKTNSRPSIDCR